MAPGMHDPTKLPHLKEVSRIKHVILEKYLPAWTRILGKANLSLCYFDCFAGPGAYEFRGKAVGGSPIIAIRWGKEFLKQWPNHHIVVTLIDENQDQIAELQRAVAAEKPFPDHLAVHVVKADSRAFVPRLLGKVPRLAPSFFTIDPYGHPLPVATMNEILRRPQTEAFINLMWFRINMDLANPVMRHNVTELLGNEDWEKQEFMTRTGDVRERGFVQYFISQLEAKYVHKFRIRYDPEDRQGNRTKYYLLHASNHGLAALLMKEVMWPLGDQEGLFDYSGESQWSLISMTPPEDDLRDILVKQFAGRELSFDEIRFETWNLPFIEKHYRSVIQDLRRCSKVDVRPVSSKKSGLRERDRVRFPKSGGQA